uniref:Transposase n=1 Tax=Timema poppense TaxID=170557 RepID=A0A7R9DLT4_TIMPO|nr:unnamed protein product [Timema poppensis]
MHVSNLICFDTTKENVLVHIQQFSATKSSFNNPHDDSREVFMFADTSHILKLSRNYYIDKGFTTS